jgi:hypothetical protein
MAERTITSRELNEGISTYEADHDLACSVLLQSADEIDVALAALEHGICAALIQSVLIAGGESHALRRAVCCGGTGAGAMSWTARITKAPHGDLRLQFSEPLRHIDMNAETARHLAALLVVAANAKPIAPLELVDGNG